MTKAERASVRDLRACFAETESSTTYVGTVLLPQAPLNVVPE